MAAIDTWKENKILGNGIKSFRQDCWKLEGPDVNLGDDIFSYEIIKKNSIFWVKKNNASYDKYILPELKK